MTFILNSFLDNCVNCLVYIMLGKEPNLDYEPDTPCASVTVISQPVEPIPGPKACPKACPKENRPSPRRK